MELLSYILLPIEGTYYSEIKYNNMKTTGVVVGSFQPPILEMMDLIGTAVKECDNVVVLIGSHQDLTRNKPYSYSHRKHIISVTYPTVIVHGIFDYDTDKQWSFVLDAIISIYENPLLYGFKKSYLNVYCGEHKCKRI